MSQFKGQSFTRRLSWKTNHGIDSVGIIKEPGVGRKQNLIMLGGKNEEFDQVRLINQISRTMVE